ncbi:acylphosphatase-2 isoform X1 [Cinclus cinclus]|uniref:acylphosphatase-2 isoform X1 n=1 Tax=Cinclus cinclus TaxID=127875 RepID=UPI002E1675D8
MSSLAKASGALRSVDYEVFGRVQGVCFRMYTEQEAKKLGVVGWVKNTSQGTVTGQVQGPEEKVNEILLSNQDFSCQPAGNQLCGEGPRDPTGHQGIPDLVLWGPGKLVGPGMRWKSIPRRSGRESCPLPSPGKHIWSAVSSSGVIRTRSSCDGCGDEEGLGASPCPGKAEGAGAVQPPKEPQLRGASSLGVPVCRDQAVFQGAQP